MALAITPIVHFFDLINVEPVAIEEKHILTIGE
jgi:hypothetical protein